MSSYSLLRGGGGDCHVGSSMSLSLPLSLSSAAVLSWRALRSGVFDWMLLLAGHSLTMMTNRIGCINTCVLVLGDSLWRDKSMIRKPCALVHVHRLLGDRFLDDTLRGDMILGDRLIRDRLLGDRLLGDRLCGTGDDFDIGLHITNGIFAYGHPNISYTATLSA